MKIIFYILYMLLYPMQVNDFVLSSTINSTGKDISSDELGNLYLLKENKILKYDNDGNLLKTYTDLYAGDLYSIDASNPFKVLVFYKDFGQVEFLDNMLSMTGDAIDLSDLGYSQTTLVCSSYENGFWIYDSQSFQLIRFDQNLQISQRSGDLTTIIQNAINPNFLIEKDDYVYLNDPALGVIIFDKYGTYYRTIPVKGLHSFQITSNKLIYFTALEINIIDLKTSDVSITKLPEENPVDIIINTYGKKEKLYILNSKAINIYGVI